MNGVRKSQFKFVGDFREAKYTHLREITGCSSAWLERYVRDLAVAGSNQVIPIFKKGTGSVCGAYRLFAFESTLQAGMIKIAS